VCCTYTQKQVILTKEHDAEAECTIFHNDIRSHGKDFERFYERAENLPDVRFFRSYVSIVKENPETRNVTIRYSAPDNRVAEEEFDMVVLSVGLNPPADVKGLATKFGIELDAHGFSKAIPFNPMETTRPGIFVSGTFQGPTDIPESVFSASAAGAQCGEFLDYRRGDLAKQRIFPLERDASKEEPKIGVFVCHCGANIGRIVGVPSAVEYALTLPNVVYAQEQLFSCATNSAQQISQRKKGSIAWLSLPAPPGPSSRCSVTPFGRRELTSIISTWPISENIVPGSTQKKRKRLPKRQRTSYGCR
jgi:heterodisulfide reductase subunit A